MQSNTPIAKGELSTAETSENAVSGLGGTAARPEASGTKGEIMVYLDLVSGFLERAMGDKERERGKGKKKRPVAETEKKPADDLNSFER